MTADRPPTFGKAKRAGRARLLSALLAVQAAAAAFFLIDIAEDIGGWSLLPSENVHFAIELAVVLTLIAGVALAGVEIRRVMARQQRIEDQLRAVSGAFFELMEEHFDAWALTPAERDVALLTIKGLTIAEIAAARSTRAGTVKAQCGAVYAKAGVSGRTQLLGLFVDELMDDRLRPG